MMYGSNYYMGSYGWGNMMGSGFWGFMGLIALWALVWKAFALWKAARRGDIYWFVALLVINTAGILDILYLYVFSEPKGLLKVTTNTVAEGPTPPPVPTQSASDTSHQV